jgi:hypothetical protein
MISAGHMQHRIYVVLIALAAVSLACSLFVRGPDMPSQPTPASPEALQSHEQDLEAALSNSVQDGVLRVSLNESQVTAFLAARLVGQSDPQIIDPQVVLRDGLMIVHGRARSGVIEAEFSITTRFDIDGSGKPVLEIVEASFGSLPMPQALRDAIGTVLEEALTGSIGPAAVGFRLEAIEIASGQLTVTGRLR